MLIIQTLQYIFLHFRPHKHHTPRSSLTHFKHHTDHTSVISEAALCVHNLWVRGCMNSWTSSCCYVVSRLGGSSIGKCIVLRWLSAASSSAPCTAHHCAGYSKYYVTHFHSLDVTSDSSSRTVVWEADTGDKRLQLKLSCSEFLAPADIFRHGFQHSFVIRVSIVFHRRTGVLFHLCSYSQMICCIEFKSIEFNGIILCLLFFRHWTGQ